MNEVQNIKYRNLFIDFLKGLCIIAVVFTHNLPDSIMKGTVFIAWGGMAVPLFLLIQSYHIFHAENNRISNGLPTKTLKKYYNLVMIKK